MEHKCNFICLIVTNFIVEGPCSNFTISFVMQTISCACRILYSDIKSTLFIKKDNVIEY